jgi:gamma-glutamyltranspeptidase
VIVKPIRPVATVQVRRELAQLLKRLRTIRRAKLSSGEIAEQISAALREAGTISRMVSAYP